MGVLVAAGALAGDDPTVRDARVVLAALQPNPMAPGRGGSVTLPQPWRSLLASPGHRRGPNGSLVVNAQTPVFDGVSVAVLELGSTEEAFTVDVETTGNVGTSRPFAWSLDETDLVWWATDDRANSYLGQVGQWSGGDGEGRGEVGFWPALDPAAQRLDIMPTTLDSQAVLPIPLVWEKRS